jgi:hypothetical protein
MSGEVFVGMDVSQACVDVAVHPGTAFQFTHDKSGIAQTVERLRALHPTLIMLEGPGGPSPWEQLKGQIYLGSEDFVARHQPTLIHAAYRQFGSMDIGWPRSPSI